MIPRYQLGERATFSFQIDASQTPVSPSSAPTLRIYNGSGTKIKELTIPPLDTDNVTGLFQHFVPLNDNFVVGVYSWRASATVAGADWVAEGMFEIVAGGGQDGAVTSLFFLDNPAVSHLLYQVDGDDGVLLARNPRI